MKRSKFSLSHQKLLSCDMGELVPMGLVEVLPGDSIQQATNVLLRASPLLSPVMHPVDVRVHHWYVPHRLVWSDWEDFITGGGDGLNNSTFPTITIGGGSGAAVGSLADYLGVPTGINNIVVSALPFRGYSLIWNEWYRDQDLQSELTIDLTDGADTTTNTALQNCAWEKDYFTAARPWEQKGPTITVPLGTTAPVRREPASGAFSAAGIIRSSGGSPYTQGTTDNLQATATTGVLRTPNQNNLVYDPNGTLVTDLSAASAVTVTALREALALQRFEEARARYGSRYVEYLRYLGVRSSDARLNRPEYLGGGRSTIQFSEVLTTGTFGAEPVGSLKGHGIASMRSNRYRRFIEEHGYIFSFLSVKPKTMYLQGLARHWNRREKEDYWQRELEHIGQQEVLNKEIYAAHGTPDGIFGYSDRYAEYRSNESWVSGEFRSTLNFWHFARNFGSAPALNADFVKCVPPETPFASSSSDVLWVMARHSIQARRLVSGSSASYIY